MLEFQFADTRFAIWLGSHPTRPQTAKVETRIMRKLTTRIFIIAFVLIFTIVLILAVIVIIVVFGKIIKIVITSWDWLSGLDGHRLYSTVKVGTVIFFSINLDHHCRCHNCHHVHNWNWLNMSIVIVENWELCLGSRWKESPNLRDSLSKNHSYLLHNNNSYNFYTTTILTTFPQQQGLTMDKLGGEIMSSRRFDAGECECVDILSFSMSAIFFQNIDFFSSVASCRLQIWTFWRLVGREEEGVKN